jgi:periplasmic protein TonB
MASPAEITIPEALPETLPEDFVEWDDEESPPAQAFHPAGSQPGSYGKVAPKAATSRKAAPPPRARSASEAGRLRFFSLPSGKAGRAARKQARKKWLVLAGAVLFVILSAALIPGLHRREAPAMKVAAAPALAKNLPQANTTSTPKPQDAAPQSPLSTLTAPDQESDSRPPAQAKPKNDRQHAPARIRMAAAPTHQTPPSSSLAAAAPDGSDKNTAIGSVSHGEGQSRLPLASPTVVDLPAGAAFSLLIRRPPPVYPQLAREFGVAGTVVLEVHISKNGTVEDLRVVSGPKLLQQAAVDAVRTWRYRPYRINNQPAEIETNIAVDFSLPD